MKVGKKFFFVNFTRMTWDFQFGSYIIMYIKIQKNRKTILDLENFFFSNFLLNIIIERVVDCATDMAI